MSGFFKRLSENASIGAMFANVNYTIILVLLFLVAMGYGETLADKLMNVASACVGLGLGWILGIVVSPSDESEQSEFSAYTKALSTFFTGYVAGVLKDVKLHNIMLFLRETNVTFRVSIAAASFLATTAVVFLNRRAEVQNRNRRWFIHFEPPTANVPNATPLGLLDMGPYCSRDDAERQISRLSKLAQYSGVTLRPVAQLIT